MRIQTVGIDIGKTVFHLVAMDERGKIVAKKHFSRNLLAYTTNLQTCLIGEACCGARYLCRKLARQSHDIRLIPAQFVIRKAISEIQQE